MKPRWWSRWSLRSQVLTLAGVLTLALTGCYRLASPPDVGEVVRLEIVGNHSHVVRAQGYFTDALAKALVARLGWRVSPAGTAKLQLTLSEEVIDPQSRDRRGVTNSWAIRLSGNALLVARGGSLTGTFTGVGNATGLVAIQGEPEALQAAASQAADDLVSWLDVRARDLVPPAAPATP
jgi:hypothetical protein